MGILVNYIMNVFLDYYEFLLSFLVDLAITNPISESMKIELTQQRFNL